MLHSAFSNEDTTTPALPADEIANRVDDDVSDFLEGLLALRNHNPEQDVGTSNTTLHQERNLQKLLGFCGVESAKEIPSIWSEFQSQQPSSSRRMLTILTYHFAAAAKIDPRVDFAPSLDIVTDIEKFQLWYPDDNEENLSRGITPFAFVRLSGDGAGTSLETGDTFMNVLSTYVAAIRILFGTRCQLYQPLKELLTSFSSRMRAIRAVGIRYRGWYFRAMRLISEQSREFFKVVEIPNVCKDDTPKCFMQDVVSFIMLCQNIRKETIVPMGTLDEQKSSDDQDNRQLQRVGNPKEQIKICIGKPNHFPPETLQWTEKPHEEKLSCQQAVLVTGIRTSGFSAKRQRSNARDTFRRDFKRLKVKDPERTKGRILRVINPNNSTKRVTRIYIVTRGSQLQPIVSPLKRRMQPR